MRLRSSIRETSPRFGRAGSSAGAGSAAALRRLDSKRTIRLLLGCRRFFAGLRRLVGCLACAFLALLVGLLVVAAALGVGAVPVVLRVAAAVLARLPGARLGQAEVRAVFCAVQRRLLLLGAPDARGGGPAHRAAQHVEVALARALDDHRGRLLALDSQLQQDRGARKAGDLLRDHAGRVDVPLVVRGDDDQPVGVVVVFDGGEGGLGVGLGCAGVGPRLARNHLHCTM
ncbi:ATP-dependent Clp protease ATP-binding subunit [Babesia caballi]|uniref:ATP-dependent Clp protease ATP-binding subunit n=1 Tax=Babesia caballi TaxID=5871 RepID=A0AAV4LLQ4_BABCB|nr:ATP-dependent Clp protease ATP-binding subunit [Babesia caballi]